MLEVHETVRRDADWPASLFCTLCGIWTVYDPGSPGNPGCPWSPVDAQNTQSACRKRSGGLCFFTSTFISFGSWVPSLSPGSWTSRRSRDGAVSCDKAQSHMVIQQSRLFRPRSREVMLTSKEVHEVHRDVSMGADDTAVTRWTGGPRRTGGTLMHP